MRTLLFVAIFVSEASLLFGQSPGNVSGNLRWWLKANAGVYENDAGTDAAEAGDEVRLWDDQSTINNNAVNAGVATRMPIYRTGIINGYPALEFNGNDFLDASALSGIGATESFYIFLVFKQNSYQTNGATTDGAGTFIIDRRDVTENLTSFKVVNTDKYFYQRRQDDGSNLGGPVSTTAVNTTSFVAADYFRNRVDGSNSFEGIYLNGKLEPSPVQSGPTGNITGPLLKIGNHATNVTGGLDGYFTEIAVYNANLTAAERQRIESYLALKYGITLDQTTATNYVRSGGNTIYSAATFAGYLSDVAGIGRDDNSGFSQTASQSQNANSVVTISNPSNLNNNNEFLVWGSNNGSLTVPSTSDLPGGIVRKLSRIWRAAEPNGNIGTVTVTVDLSAVPGTKNSAHLRLLVDANGVFAAGSTAYTPAVSAGPTYTFTGVTINDGYYFTIGTTNASTTPLPIDLVDFNVTYENPVVVASWNTASELNNDFFMLERAGTDLQFEILDTLSGAGNSKIPRAYSTIDPYPYEGRSYYRLSQTDFDGTVTYFSPKSISIEETQKRLSAFPNPNDGRIIHFRWGNAKFNLNYVEVIDYNGKTLETAYHESGNLREYSIELKHRLSSGFYILKVHYNGKDEFVKLLVK